MKTFAHAFTMAVLLLTSGRLFAGGEDFPFACGVDDLVLSKYSLHRCDFDGPDDCDRFYVNVTTHELTQFTMNVDVTEQNRVVTIRGDEAIPLNLMGRHFLAQIPVDRPEESQAAYANTALGIQLRLDGSLKPAHCSLQ